ncbi:hypothetical protein ACWCQQ_43735 [Streptomyces sp. NPDC002143]
MVFGRAARSAELALVTVLPSRNGVPEVLEAHDRRAAGELLLLSQQVRLLGYDPDDPDACMGADERLLGSCARLPAIWDGSPSDGPRRHSPPGRFPPHQGVHVEVLWPVGAARMSPDEQSPCPTP